MAQIIVVVRTAATLIWSLTPKKLKLAVNTPPIRDPSCMDRVILHDV